MIGRALAAAALGVGVSWSLVAVVREAAMRRGLLDVPNTRSSHDRPTPRLGGLGIVAAVTVATLVGYLAIGGDTRAALVLVGIGVVVAAVSLVDDLRGLPALVRLAVHVAAATAAVASLGPSGRRRRRERARSVRRRSPSTASSACSGSSAS